MELTHVQQDRKEACSSYFLAFPNHDNNSSISFCIQCMASKICTPDSIPPPCHVVRMGLHISSQAESTYSLNSLATLTRSSCYVSRTNPMSIRTVNHYHERFDAEQAMLSTASASAAVATNPIPIQQVRTPTAHMYRACMQAVG